MSVRMKLVYKSCSRLNGEVSTTLREGVHPSKVGGYELVLWAAEHWGTGSASTNARPK